MTHKQSLFKNHILSMVILSAVFVINSFATEKTTGRELFQLNCSGCHGKNLQGNPPTYPSLIGISKKLSRTEIQNQIQNGKNLMPSFGFLAEEQKGAIVDFLLTGTEKKVDEASAAEKGRMLVHSNCLSCHRLAPTDPRPAGARWMQPPLLAGVGQRFGIGQFKSIINRGPCYMPSFSYLEEVDKENIYAFLETQKHPGQENGMTGRRRWRGDDRCGGSGRCGCN
jgi:mono/diheme cytochrome c family protein